MSFQTFEGQCRLVICQRVQLNGHHPSLLSPSLWFPHLHSFNFNTESICCHERVELGGVDDNHGRKTATRAGGDIVDEEEEVEGERLGRESMNSIRDERHKGVGKRGVVESELRDGERDVW
ncbi:hypothetical protein PIB30_008070 [Stylosanthes scabra]|uniref:Uncharacterized protein n=1 Tax=Stylosanthes scabra TaxID=79078 RepID=A0ABU6W346_9FABA|nr:hypothetical protein [Stylosanthes scabra]